MKDPMTDPKPITRNYEASDIDAGRVWLIGAVLVFGLIFTSLSMALFYQLLTVRTERMEGPILPPLPKTEKTFPSPQLQARPADDLASLRKRDDAVLTSYRWIDPQLGVMQIPIDRAMELLVKRGLPVGTKEAPGPTWTEMLQQRAGWGTTGGDAEGRKP